MRRRGFMLIDIVIGVVVMSATFGLMITLSISMTDHLARLRRARDIDAFAIGVLEGVIVGEEQPGVVAGGGGTGDTRGMEGARIHNARTAGGGAQVGRSGARVGRGDDGSGEDAAERYAL